MKLSEFQNLIKKTYHRRDKSRGIDKNFIWFTEEVGELAEAVRKRSKREIFEEAADVLAWLSTLCSLSGVDLERAALAKYGKGCPRCGTIPCTCP